MAIQSKQETIPSASHGLACAKSMLDIHAYGMHVLLLHDCWQVQALCTLRHVEELCNTVGPSLLAFVSPIPFLGSHFWQMTIPLKCQLLVLGSGLHLHGSQDMSQLLEYSLKRELYMTH